MPYSLSFIENNDYLHVSFDGNFLPGDVKPMWREILDYLHTHPHKYILVEEQPGATGQLNTLEVYKTAEFLSQSRLTRGVRVALLYQTGVTQNTLQQAIFGETVAVNRGLNLRVFRIKEDAEQWLVKK